MLTQGQCAPRLFWWAILSSTVLKRPVYTSLFFAVHPRRGAHASPLRRLVNRTTCVSCAREFSSSFPPDWPQALPTPSEQQMRREKFSARILGGISKPVAARLRCTHGGGISSKLHPIGQRERTPFFYRYFETAPGKRSRDFLYRSMPDTTRTRHKISSDVLLR